MIHSCRTFERDGLWGFAVARGPWTVYLSPVAYESKEEATEAAQCWLDGYALVAMAG